MLATSISQGSGEGWPHVLCRDPTWLTSLTRNCFLWWCLPKYGVPSGFGDMFFSAQIRKLLYTSWLPGCQRSNALCVFSAIHSLLLLSLTLLSLHSISPAFITTLLMLFPTFIGRTSGVWHPWHNLTQFQSLLNPGSSWSLLHRAPVSLLFGAGFGFLYPRHLFVGPEEVLWLLLSWLNLEIFISLALHAQPMSGRCVAA